MIRETFTPAIPRRLAVAADGDHVPPVAGAVEQDPGADGDGQEDEHRRRDADHLAGAEPAHAVEVEDRDRVLSLIQSAAPRAMANMASVAMNGTTLP